MSFFKKAKASAAINRAEEEAAYAAALREIESGTRRDGLWAKALAESSGPEEAKGRYIKLRVRAYMDERNVAEYVADREDQEQQSFERRVMRGRDAEKEEIQRLKKPQNSTSKEQEDDSAPSLSDNFYATVFAIFMSSLCMGIARSTSDYPLLQGVFVTLAAVIGLIALFTAGNFLGDLAKLMFASARGMFQGTARKGTKKHGRVSSRKKRGATHR